MRIINCTLPRNCNIFLFGDDHEGAALRHNKGFEQLVDKINSDYGGLKHTRNFAVDHGDCIEGITIDDKRYHFFETKERSILQQIENAKKHRKHIAKKLLVGLDGNHPFKLSRTIGNISQQVYQGTEGNPSYLRVPYGTWACVLVYKDKLGFVMFRHYATHGFGSITSQAKDVDQELANKLALLKKKLKKKVGNALLMSMGHTHQLLVNRPKKRLVINEVYGSLEASHSSNSIVNSDNEIPPDDRYYVNTGSFLKQFDLKSGDHFSGYAERAGYDPIELGFAVCRVRDGNIADIDEVFLE